MSAISASTTARLSASAAHTWSGSPSTIQSRTVWASWPTVVCVSTPMEALVATVTRPASGTRSPVRMRSRVVLPSPLRPTTPITSPAPRPRETESSRMRVPKPCVTASRLTRFATRQRPRIADRAPFIWMGPFGMGALGRIASRARMRCWTSVILAGVSFLGSFLIVAAS